MNTATSKLSVSSESYYTATLTVFELTVPDLYLCVLRSVYCTRRRYASFTRTDNVTIFVPFKIGSMQFSGAIYT